LKEEALYRTMWRARFGRGFGPVIRQTTEWMNTYKFKALPPRISFYGDFIANIAFFSVCFMFITYNK